MSHAQRRHVERFTDQECQARLGGFGSGVEMQKLQIGGQSEHSLSLETIVDRIDLPICVNWNYSVMYRVHNPTSPSGF